MLKKRYLDAGKVPYARKTLFDAEKIRSPFKNTSQQMRWDQLYAWQIAGALKQTLIKPEDSWSNK